VPCPERTTKKSSRNPGPPVETIVALSLGGNDDRTAGLMVSALDMLTGDRSSRGARLLPALTEPLISDLYRTAPVSRIPQPDFLNAALVATTTLTPAALLASLKLCERLTGRRRTERWGPRPLDIDLLVFGNVVIERPELRVPHLRLRERRFYLEPLSQIAPDLPVPPDGVTVAELLRSVPPARSERIRWERAAVPTHHVTFNHQ
jgi:2-amino-4-hydroxy-6-hydroxymethyldihydropteridine diphosphokinase